MTGCRPAYRTAARSRARMLHTCPHADAHMHTHAHGCAHTEAHAHAPTHTCRHTCTHVHTQRLTCTQRRTHAHPDAHMHTHVHTQRHMHAHTCTETHTWTHMHMHTDTHAHSQVHTQRLTPPLSGSGGEGPGSLHPAPHPGSCSFVCPVVLAQGDPEEERLLKVPQAPLMRRV